MQPRGEEIPASRGGAEVALRIVQWIVEEFRELLGERLDVAVGDDGGRRAKVGSEYEGVAGRGVDAVRSPGAADGRVSGGVIGGVVRDRDDQFSILMRNLPEEFLLQKLGIDDREGSPALFRGQEIAVADRDGNGDVLDLGLAEQGMALLVCREGGAEQRVSILRFVSR